MIKLISDSSTWCGSRGMAGSLCYWADLDSLVQSMSLSEPLSFSTCLINQIMNLKSLLQCLVHSNCSVKVSDLFFYIITIFLLYFKVTTMMLLYYHSNVYYCSSTVL